MTKKKSKKEKQDLIEKILLEGTPEEKRELYGFDKDDNDKMIAKKFNLFMVGEFVRYLKFKSPKFHDKMVLNYVKAYRGKINYLNIGFRGSSKTSLKKLFDVFTLLNDKDKTRKYYKVMTKDVNNSKQIVTDIYNLILEVQGIYGNPFVEDLKDEKKGQKTMSAFDFKDGRKYAGGTVGQTVRGQVADANRPDYIWFEDIEDSTVVKSVILTEKIVAKVDEAIQGMSEDGNFVCTANYISDEGVIEWIKQKKDIKTTIIPIIDKKGKATWAEKYPPHKIKKVKTDALDWEGDYLCDPTTGKGKFFNIEKVKEALKHTTKPIKEVRGMKLWQNYFPGEKYALGCDTAEGIGNDSNASVLINFTKSAIIGIYHNNEIAPDDFGLESVNIGRLYGECLLAVEKNNTGHATLSAVKNAQYGKIYHTTILDQINDTKIKRIGWITNGKTKPIMFYDFKKAFEAGEIKIYSEELLTEMLHYTKADFINRSTSKVITRHFDILTSACIAWQMKNEANQQRGIKVTLL